MRQSNLQVLSILLRTNGFDRLIAEEILLDNVYEVELDNVRRVMDLGGNTGVSALYFARKYPKAEICAVEPIPENLAVLRRNVELNRLPIRVVPAAARARDGKTSFELVEDTRQHAAKFALPDRPSLPVKGTVDVDVLSVSSLMALMDWQEFDLLKIDIEGLEKEVLGGRPSWLNRVRAIVGEGHLGAGYTFEAARRDLEPFGFNLKLLHENPGAVFQFYAHRPD